jgi:hypothetical protein
VRARFPVPLSIRACGFPAHGLPMIFLAWRRDPGIADGAHQPVQAQLPEPLARPEPPLAGPQVAAVALDQQPFEPPGDVVVDLDELVGGVTGTEVVAPAAQDRIELPEVPFRNTVS